MRILNFLFAPPDTTLESGGETALSTDDIYDALAPEVELVEEKPEKETEDLLEEGDDKEPKKKDKKEEELELEDEEEDKDIDDLEPISEFRRKDFIKKYPDAFKEFPELERAYYVEKKYAELLPTLDDAKVAVEKSETYDRFEQQLLAGNLDTIMSSVKTADPKAFNKMVDDYLPLLSKVDQSAYFHVISGIIKTTVAGMVHESGRLQNEDLKTAALLLNQYIFGKSEFDPHKKFGPVHAENDEAADKLKNERAEFVKEKFETTLDDLQTRANNVVKSTIASHIDPKGVMTDYVKKVAIREAMETVDTLIGNDVRFKAILDKLWSKSFEKNFSRETQKDIERAYLNKVKSLLPSVIQKHRKEALVGLGKRVTEEREEPVRKGPVATGRPATAKNSGPAKSPGRMTTLEFLNSDD